VVGLRQGLRDLGYVEGQEVVLEIRAGQGRYETALEAARALVKRGVHVFVSAGTVATKAVKEAAGDLPIVFTQVGEPVAAGFARTIARPGGNMTGFSHLLVDTTGKRLELLRELVPGARTVLVVFDPENPTSGAAAAEARLSAEMLRVSIRQRHVKTRDEVLAALRELDRNTVDAILMLPDSLVVNAGDQIIAMSGQKRIPVMFHEETWVERGGLASYGASFVDLGRQAARYVDKILKGAKPADLPVEQPTKFELVINLKTAKALGLTIPQSVLIRADKVIQ
jgi:putative ABC transport system substrate-binding protein